MTNGTPITRSSLAIAVAITLSAPVAQATPVDCAVTVAKDDGTGATSGTLSWAIATANNGGSTKYSSGHPGGGCSHDVITLKTDVTVTGVMKRLIDSDMLITSAPPACTHNGRCEISGDGKFRPLFIKSGNQVVIRDVNLVDGLAKGGTSTGTFVGGGGGAGLGGAVFGYSGSVVLQNVDFDNNQALGGSGNTPSRTSSGGGAGMYAGGAEDYGGGLFGGQYGGNGLYGGGLKASFGTGGTIVGVYGGAVAGNGGFGGGGGGSGMGSMYGPPTAQGGFGGGNGATSSNTPSGGGAGAGLGGALFIKRGSLSLQAVNFDGNSVQGGQGAKGAGNGKGLGGALFICTKDLRDDGSNQAATMCSGSIDEQISCGVDFGSSTANKAPDGQPDLYWNDGGGMVSPSSLPSTCGRTTTHTQLDTASSQSTSGQPVTFTMTVTNPANAKDVPDGSVTV